MQLLLYVVYALGLSTALSRAGFRSQGTPSVPVAPRQPPKRVLIVGASGGTGRRLVEQALERGYSVTALVRQPSRLVIQHAQLSVVKGDVLDERSIDTAVRGHDAVVSALGHKRYFGPTRILSDGTRNILRAMERHEVPRFVCETSLGIGESAGRMGLVYTLFVVPVILPFYFWDKTRQERAIAASSTEWVIVRPGALTDGAKRGIRAEGASVGSFLRTVKISRADVAAFMLDQLTSDLYLRKAPGISG
jgi:uncharacterized protein YbjT (DUF2867 family)